MFARRRRSLSSRCYSLFPSAERGWFIFLTVFQILSCLIIWIYVDQTKFHGEIPYEMHSFMRHESPSHYQPTPSYLLADSASEERGWGKVELNQSWVKPSWFSWRTTSEDGENRSSRVSSEQFKQVKLKRQNWLFYVRIQKTGSQTLWKTFLEVSSTMSC